MEINESDLKLIIESVINKLENHESKMKKPDGLSEEKTDRNGIFKEINDAINAAESAYLQLITLTLEQRKKIIRNIRKSVINNLEKISKLAVEETGLGRVADKIENKVSKVDIVVEAGDPADEILMTAKRLDSDIIIIGYKGYGKEGRFLLGSVTDKVVRHASRSVLVVR